MSKSTPLNDHNLTLVSYPAWRVRLLARVAAMVGVIVHIDGIPFGRTRKRPAPGSTDRDGGAVGDVGTHA